MDSSSPACVAYPRDDGLDRVRSLMMDEATSRGPYGPYTATEGAAVRIREVQLRRLYAESGWLYSGCGGNVFTTRPCAHCADPVINLGVAHALCSWACVEAFTAQRVLEGWSLRGDLYWTSIQHLSHPTLRVQTAAVCLGNVNFYDVGL